MPDKDRAIIESLAIETTRRCNMNCAHCLRGEPEDLGMPAAYLENVFARAAGVDVLTFTGGEPALGADAMHQALKCCEARKIPIREVYVATNGKSVNGKFLDALRQWDAYCKQSQCHVPEYTGGTEAMRMVRSLTDAESHAGIKIDLSLDAYHEDIPVENILALMSLPGTLGLGKYNPEKDDGWLIRTGRAEWNGMGGEDSIRRRAYAYDERALDAGMSRDESGAWRIPQLYVSCDGSIVKHCDYDYRDIPEYALCSAAGPDWLDRIIPAPEGIDAAKDECRKAGPGQAVFEIILGDGQKAYLAYQFSDNDAAADGCDACIDYYWLDGTFREIDGGEMDYAAKDRNYRTLADALDDIAGFAFDGQEIRSVKFRPDLDYERLGL